MKRVLIIAAIAVASCASPRSPAERQCAGVIRELIRSPQTLEIDRSVASGVEVWIEGTAANAYGTPVRVRARCLVLNGSVQEMVLDGAEVDPFQLLAADVRASSR